MKSLNTGGNWSHSLSLMLQIKKHFPSLSESSTFSLGTEPPHPPRLYGIGRFPRERQACTSPRPRSSRRGPLPCGCPEPRWSSSRCSSSWPSSGQVWGDGWSCRTVPPVSEYNYGSVNSATTIYTKYYKCVGNLHIGNCNIITTKMKWTSKDQPVHKFQQTLYQNVRDTAYSIPGGVSK